MVIHVRQHDLFHREGNDLLCEMPIPVDLAVLGGEVEVPTPDGPVALKIEPGTGTGQTLRLRGHGVRAVDGYGKGDLHVRVVVEVPVSLNSRQKKAAKDLHEALTQDNYPIMGKLRERAQAFYRRKQEVEKLGADK